MWAMVGFSFCKRCGVPIHPFGEDTCYVCEPESRSGGKRLSVRKRALVDDPSRNRTEHGMVA